MLPSSSDTAARGTVDEPYEALAQGLEDIKASLARLEHRFRSGLDEGRDELRSALAGVRTELRTGLAEVRASVARLERRLDAGVGKGRDER